MKEMGLVERALKGGGIFYLLHDYHHYHEKGGLGSEVSDQRTISVVTAHLENGPVTVEHDWHTAGVSQLIQAPLDPQSQCVTVQ